jgi:23S rRNA pseudouridine1911/1915/1917 synthase
MVTYNPEAGETVDLLAPAEAAGQRVDAWLSQTLPAQSRSFLRKLIDDGYVEIAGHRTKASRKLAGGEAITLFVPELVELEARPEPMDLAILYEDHDIIVVNKGPGRVVHPSPGHESGSLVNGLLHHCTDLSGIGGVLRPGIVHRLDRDTSGVIIAAKNDAAHHSLAAQFANRTTEKVYLTLTHEVPVPSTGRIEARIGRHPRHPVLMAVVRAGRSKEATTDYRLVEAHGPFAFVECRPKTGRTHQIRVHMAHIGCPILCDHYYGRERRLSRAELTGIGVGQASGEEAHPLIDRQALHAHRLSFDHPRTGERLTLEADLHDDMAGTLQALRTRRD